MNNYRQLLVFADGDAYDPSTWSNVPYMFVNAFSSDFPNIPIRTCNIRINNSTICAIGKIYNKLMSPLLGPLCTFNRTKLYSRLVQHKMQKAIKSLDLTPAILLSFDFSNLPSKRQDEHDCAAFFCDWTIEYEIREHQKRMPTSMEKKLIQQQNATILKADHVTSIFPYASEYIEKNVIKKCYYSGKHKNVDNHIKPEINFNRTKSNHFLFIGNEAYLPGLQIIAKAIKKYNMLYPDNQIYIDVIGMVDGVADFDEHIVFHGYLNKKNSEEAYEYYSLIRNARALITVSDKWVGASSIMEVMSLGTPVIISPNKELKEMFGEEIPFGWWSAPNQESVLSAIEQSMQLQPEELRQMCEAAAAELDGSDWCSLVRRWAKAIGIEKS